VQPCEYLRRDMHAGHAWRRTFPRRPGHLLRLPLISTSVTNQPELSFNRPRFEEHLPTRPVDRDKAEKALSENIKKATNAEEIAPKQKHVRSESS
jgi:hypothetical protein